jgi:hypothetical protein
MIKKLTLLMLWVAYGLTKAIAQDLAPITPTTISPNFTWYKKITGVDTSFYGYSNNNWVNFARREWVKKNIKDSLASYSKNVNVIHNFGNEDKHGNLRFYTGSDSPFGEVLMFDVGGLTTNGHVLTPTFYYGLNARINNDNTYIGQGSIAFGNIANPYHSTIGYGGGGMNLSTQGDSYTFTAGGLNVLTLVNYIHQGFYSNMDYLAINHKLYVADAPISETGVVRLADLSPYALNSEVVQLHGSSQVVTHAIRFDDFIRSQAGGSYSQLYGVEWQTGNGNKASLATGTIGNDIEFTANGSFSINTPANNYKFSSNITRLGDGASVLWSSGGNTLNGTQSLASGEYNVYNGGVNYTQMQLDRFQVSNQAGQTAYKTSSIEYVDFTTGWGKYIYFAPATGSNKAIYFPDANGVIALTSDLSAYATEELAMHKTGTEVITGNKTIATGTTLSSVGPSDHVDILNGSIAQYGPGNISVRYSTYASALEPGGLTLYNDNSGSTGFPNYGRNSFYYFNGTYQQIINFTSPSGNNALTIPDKPGSHTFAFLDDISNGYVSLTGSYSNPSWLTSLPYTKINNIPANSILANNTGGTSAPSAITYFDSGEQAYIDNVNWTGTTSPSGTPTSSYRWTQIGKMVSLRLTLAYPTAGTALTQVDADMPADIPPPLAPASFSTDELIYQGWGGMSTSKSDPITQTARVSLNEQSGTWKLTMLSVATDTKVAHFNYTYYTP